MSHREKTKFPSLLVVDLLRLTGFVISKLFWFIRYRGTENIPPNDSRPFLIAANHQTYIDPVWICLPMRRRIRYMAIEKAFRWKFVGSLIRYVGALPVALDQDARLPALRNAVKALRAGAVLTIFPEGERELLDGKLLPFKGGVVHLALQTNSPILPVTVIGGNKIWPPNQKYPRLFRKVEIVYHPLWHPTQNSMEGCRADLENLTRTLREMVSVPD